MEKIKKHAGEQAPFVQIVMPGHFVAFFRNIVVKNSFEIAKFIGVAYNIYSITMLQHAAETDTMLWN